MGGQIIFGKWKNKLDVLFLGTVGVSQMMDMQSLNRQMMKKPYMRVDYNGAKGSIELSN